MQGSHAFAFAAKPGPPSPTHRADPRPLANPRPAALMVLVAGVLGPLGAIPLAAQAPYRIAQPATWVSPLELELPLGDSTAPGPIREGFEILLVDQQERVIGRRVEQFFHRAYWLLDEGAVQEWSQITIAFDSSYQDLTLHAVTVVRDGRRIDQLTRANIQILQREPRLEYQTYDGSLSLVVLLHDVRRGDVVEYSYTRRGANPVFAGHYMNAFSLASTVPVRRLQYRLLWPDGRRLFIRRTRTDLEPSVRLVGEHQEHVWARSDVPAHILDANLPDWYEPFPAIQLSDFASWSEVAAWGDSLFRVPRAPPRGLAQPLAEIRGKHQSAPERVLAALRFVQDEIRYLGIEIGENSHVPYPPATVIERRYGDCKDKALLLITMLRALGVEARPALVSTTFRGRVGAFHPTAAVFDHAIVRATIGDRAYWLDPTALYERGDLDAASPSFGAGLILDPTTEALDTIPGPPAAGPFTDIEMRFELGPVDSTTRMTVRTRYLGKDANYTRSFLRGTSSEQLQQQYAEYYSELYPSIQAAAPLEVTDDEAANVIEILERYRIAQFWRFSEDQGAHVGHFYPLELGGAVPAATVTTRTMPLKVVYPTHLRYTIEARIEEGWFIRPEKETIETPAALFNRRVEAANKLLTLTYEYQTLADHVTPEAAAEHIEKLASAATTLEFSVTAPSGPTTVSDWLTPQEANWPIGLTAAFATGIMTLLALRVYRLQAVSWPHHPQATLRPLEPQPPPSLHDALPAPAQFTAQSVSDGPRGLGGWLVLVGIGVTISPLVILATLAESLPTYAASSWAQLTTPGASRYHPAWAPVLILELIVNIGLIVFAVALAWTFYRRKSVFPALFVITTCAGVLVGWLDALVVSAISEPSGMEVAGWEAAPRNLLMALFWVAYMFRSRRVRNTFVN